MKRYVKKRNFYKAIFNMLRDGKNPSQIAKILKTSRQRIGYYIKYLKENNLIEKIGKGRSTRWRINVKEFPIGTTQPTFTKPKTNLHAVQINIPILSGKIDDKDWKKGEKLKNWTPTYKDFDVLGGITLKNNNNRSITLFLQSRDISDLKEVKELILDSTYWIISHFKEKGVILDLFRAEVKNLDIATEDKQAETKRKKGEKFTLNLDRKAEKIFPKDNRNAHSWIDGSPFKFSAETDDLLWKKRYLQMPDRTAEIHKMLQFVAENYASHVGIVEKLNNILGEPKAKKEIRKIVKDKKQTKLGDFF